MIGMRGRIDSLSVFIPLRRRADDPKSSAERKIDAVVDRIAEVNVPAYGAGKNIKTAAFELARLSLLRYQHDIMWTQTNRCLAVRRSIAVARNPNLQSLCQRHLIAAVQKTRQYVRFADEFSNEACLGAFEDFRGAADLNHPAAV